MSGVIPDDYQRDLSIIRSFARINYRKLMRNWKIRTQRELFVLQDEYNERLFRSYADMSDQSRDIAPCGIFTFDGMWSIGRDGLIADVENANVFLGHSVNWSRDYFNWWLENSGVGFERWDGPDAFWADFGSPEREDNDVVLMKSPGYGIFGHWILDFVPQLYLGRFADIPSGTRYVFDHLTDWMNVLLEAVQIGSADAYALKAVSHSRLFRLSGVKCGFAMAQPINSLAWDHLRAHFNHLNCTKAAIDADCVFVSRRNWQGDRKLSEYEALEEGMRSLGFTILHPEKLDLAGQAHHFADAKVIIGEDGSALHSIMLTNPGAVLGVLMLPDRLNLWHAGICEAAGHRLAYHPLPGDSLSPEAVADILAFASRLKEA
ncbi:MAG: glycosyltransferase family 61 protein [Novosphingobium sp.]|uniref:glycosyltransferase family 61 protein n=1 Tax=Novosphingobium sp. TaxID=1874826 RepID=UPI003B9AD174